MSITTLANHGDNEITLHAMKKIEIVVSGESEEMVSELMRECDVAGFTIIPHVSGQGHSGFHEGKLLFNDKASLVMFIAVAPDEVIAKIAIGMKTLFEKNSGVMFVSEVNVVRWDYFSK